MASTSIVAYPSAYQLDAYSPIEDRYYVNEERKWFAVFDGHGSNICSEYVHKRLPQKLIDLVDKENKSFEEAAPIAYKSVDEEFLNLYSHLKGMAVGTCALFVVVQADTIYVANTGDSLALIGHRGEDGVVVPIKINNEHNTKNADEVALLKQRTTDPNPIRGAPNSPAPGSRIGGVISVTRALGDGVFKNAHMSIPHYERYLPYLTNEPELTTYKIVPQDEFLLIASDGLFEQVTTTEVVKWIHEYVVENNHSKEACEKASEMVINKLWVALAQIMEVTVDALKATTNKKKLFDDATVIVLFFKPRT